MGAHPLYHEMLGITQEEATGNILRYALKDGMIQATLVPKPKTPPKSVVVMDIDDRTHVIDTPRMVYKPASADTIN